ncbi:MAG TPA: phytanoyl-CoA dioxygenase family protein, partial [Myxococcota bacterium]|nr:phytanoyl-CoA dioxygenase family protein [Myxococcota bacterium]
MDLKDAYVKNGYVHLERLIEPERCAQLVMRMREIVSKERPSDPSRVFDAIHQSTKTDFLVASAKAISCFFDKNADQSKDMILKNPFKALNKVGHALHELCPVYKKFSHQRIFYDLMTDLGQKKPQLVQSMFIFKQPKFGDGVPAHQDATFIHTDPCSVIGLWFALEDADIDNGCLWVLPGGHRGPLKERFVIKDGQLLFEEKKRVKWPRKDFIP